MEVLCKSIALDLIMSIYTNQFVPLWIATRCFEFFLFRADGEECLFDLLANLLRMMKPKMLKMDA